MAGNAWLGNSVSVILPYAHLAPTSGPAESGPHMKSQIGKLGWLLVALLGAFAYVVLATHRQEHLNSAYILIAALCSYAIGYRFYSKWVAARVLVLNELGRASCRERV